VLAAEPLKGVGEEREDVDLHGYGALSSPAPR
jgi:hypothetical protein